MKNLNFIIALLFATVVSGQSMTQVKVGPDDNISLKVPQNFIQMTDQDRMDKVYSSKVPLAMFTNESQDATFGINYNIMQWTENDTELIYGFYKASINNLFDKVQFVKDEIKEINGRQFIIFEFVAFMKGK